MPNVKNNAVAQETRRRLIDAAGHVFAERGLHAATIKQITERARVNTAAINYHFRDKFELYAAVVRQAAMQTANTPPAERPGGSPEDRLRAFVLEVIRDLFDRSRPAWRAAILTHEFVQPTAVLDPVIDEVIRPRADFFRGVVRDILGPRASEQRVSCGAFSLAAQCFFYLYNRAVLRRLYPELVADTNAESLAGHIAAFSLAGLYAMRDESRRQRQAASRARQGAH